MIYLDNSATTLQKPNTVAEAAAYAIGHFGNAGRSFYTPAVDSSRLLIKTRMAIAELTRLKDPMNVAFTSGATESLNLVISSLIGEKDSVITTVLEHNSVLRPLYNTDCKVQYINCDDNGDLDYDSLESLDRYSANFLVVTHGSNLIGNITDVYRLYEYAKKHGMVFILDAAQTLGSIPVYADMADIICFTGHKSLFSPMGVGGIIVNSDIAFKLVKTGGSASNSFDRHQPLTMPDIFEAGSYNIPGIAGLKAGLDFIKDRTLEQIENQTTLLTKQFLDGLSGNKNIKIYGKVGISGRLPVVSINVKDNTSDEVAVELWEEYGIATRVGSHCAPLAHKRFGTEKSGMVRFSFSCFNTAEEIDKAIFAVNKIALR